MGIFVTINLQDLNKNKYEKKNIDSETETKPEDNCLELTKNKNQVPKVFHLTAKETQIAASVLKIHTANHCNIHNRACLNVDKSKEYHVEITFMMLSTWASEISLNISLSPSILSSSSILSLTISSSTILLSQPSTLTPTQYIARSLMPTINEFLKLVDENENADDYY
ncbi:42846_t:CDS:2 [Gigaspora margarita]|uniref:42846_t:CDS:1 n=1 Tax=Gigaspora margarita TaxID=4874 RepID=A0ABN7VPV9_GIGMA|nr:42846_t:CDS:2 [Gigaspora margarita]